MKRFEPDFTVLLDESERVLSGAFAESGRVLFFFEVHKR